jgi:Na+/glutamate symporter
LGANQGASSTLTINGFTTIASNRNHPSLYAIGLPLMGFVIAGMRLFPKVSYRKRRLLSFFGALFLLSMIAFQVGCGGGAGNSKGSGSTSNAQPGTYTVTVVATGTATQVQETTVVSITVQ